jgi:hypothetical protein
MASQPKKVKPAPIVIIKVTANKQDAAILAKAAKAVGLPVATYVRLAAMEKATRPA